MNRLRNSKHRTYTWLTAALVVLGLLIGACTPMATPQPTAMPEPTEAPMEEPTEAPTEEATATLEPVDEDQEVPDVGEENYVEVVIRDDELDPKDVTIRTGTTIVWTNEGDADHTLISGAPGAPGELYRITVAPGESFRYRFEHDGTYNYYSDTREGEPGTVTVQEQLTGEEIAEIGEENYVEVAMQDNQFDPQELTIRTGTTVVWTNADDVEHTVTSGERGEPTDVFSMTVSAGNSFRYRFEHNGTYAYYCDIHDGMEGTVIVEE